MKNFIIIIISVLFVWVSSSVAQETATVEAGDSVTVAYIASIEDHIVEQAPVDAPLTFVVGNGDMIEGFEKAIIGMHKNETKTFVVVPEDAYGMPDPEAYIALKRSQLPEGIDPHVGTVIALPALNNYLVTVKEVDNDTVILDANHQLAGKEITFVVTVMDVE